MTRRTKIVCTIGPSVDSEAQIARLVDAGMNVARLNFSHGDHASHRRTFALIRRVARDKGANVAIMTDLQGPKIRTGPMRNGESVDLQAGAELTITTRDVDGDAGRISTTYANLPHDVAPGARILIADGLIELRVDRVTPPDVACTVVRPGTLGQHKGINLPGVHIAEPSLTDKDREDLALALDLGADYVALSFVRSAEDVRTLAAAITAHGGKAGIVSKIERPEALDEIEEIVRRSDALMVARGDLGVEVDFEEVPQLQKHLIHLCNEMGVPVITATQMLESMTQHPRPTRAEAADVANAVLDGTDAVMLSGETAAGRYPIEACRVMARIAERADELPPAPRPHAQCEVCGPGTHSDSFAQAIGRAVAQMVTSLDVHRIVCFTYSGYTARAIARYRPQTPVVTLTASEETRRRLALVWGVSAQVLDSVNSIDEMLERGQALLLEQGIAQPGQTILLVAGTPLAESGRTNLLKLHRVGEPL